MAGNALNVCREFFQNATPVIDTGLLATVHDNDAIRDTLGMSSKPLQYLFGHL